MGLVGSRVTAAGVKSLAAMLQCNSTLQELDLSGSHMLCDDGLCALSEGLLANRGLKRILLDGEAVLCVESWYRLSA